MEVEISNLESPEKLKNGPLKTENVEDASPNGGLEQSPRKKQQQNSERQQNGNSSQVKGKPKKKHRRGAKKKHRNKYKPYNKLTWDEKRKLDEKDAVKAVRKREELVAQKGRPIAPYNTTQFLMEEHDPGDENFQQHHHHSSTSSAEGNGKDNDDNDESCSSCASSDEYFEKDFDEFYERVHIDTLNSYTKEDLIKNCYDLEQRIENLEREVKLKDNRLQDVQQLQDENQRLLQENNELKEKMIKI
ncbi:protein HEXIM1-like [Clytia hemisphaerica]|uniref:protein HEXIM1-like n=1 Tax=Clytia hemisphaerica TaxID=252671 RepID=UPI0034D41C01